MVSHAILREIVGADLFASITGAHLRLAIRRALARLAFILRLLEFAREQFHRLLLILRLRALGSAAHIEAGGLMNDAHRRLDLVDILPARAARARGFYFQ